ncbi:type VII secretion integral membrane protein EccD [Pseudonocardia acidicola]|uniref:Type VII secretion integral membrane protein EccD n=1 Tax=Pseudonocardia acidicola TaxID=2724939 RepID=A0ABX1SFS9_9PSEU|nr:type VII secretion integral membrane protein EccD [Pseudonocardia acidicola]NMI00416.1 type VII secretion integral membrane protein EccD [Pseudonocardia acidicola]
MQGVRSGPGTTYCRLTVLAPRRRVDLALPTDVPVGELTPMVLELLGEPARTGEGRPVPWRLSGAAGGLLPPEATLTALGVLDGELLRIGPAAAPPPAPVFDDPVDALAAISTHTGGGDVLGRWLGPGAVLALAGAAAWLIAGVRADAGTGSPVVGLAVALGSVAAAAGVLRAAQPASGAEHEALPGTGRIAGLTAALAAVPPAAVPPAAAAGWAALPGPPGAAHLLLAAAAGGTVAAAGQIALRVVAPALIAAAVVAVAAGTAALLRLWFGVPVAALAAGWGTVVLAGGPLLPRLALRLAGLPRPQVPTDAGELVAADTAADLLPPAELAERADLARGYLAGAVGGGAVVAAAAAVLAAGAPGWAGPAFAGVTVCVLLLRARGFADPVPARTLVVTGLAAGVAALVPAASAAAPAGRLGLASALLAAAAAGAAVVRAGEHAGSPVSRRAVDMLEMVLVALAIPLALGVMGLYGLVRGL